MIRAQTVAWNIPDAPGDYSSAPIALIFATPWRDSKTDQRSTQGQRTNEPKRVATDATEQQIHHGPSHSMSPSSWRRAAPQRIDRIFSCTGEVQEQEATDDAEV